MKSFPAANRFVFPLLSLFIESSDEDEASGDEGLPDDDSDVSCSAKCAHI